MSKLWAGGGEGFGAGGRKSFWLCGCWAWTGHWPPREAKQTRLALEGDQLVAPGVEVCVNLWQVFVHLRFSLSPPAFLLKHSASLLNSKSSSAYRMLLKIMPWISVFQCAQMDVCTYQTLQQMKFIISSSNRYKNVAVGLIFTSELGSNPHCSLCVFTPHVKNIFPHCHFGFLAQNCICARSGVPLILQESSACDCFSQNLVEKLKASFETSCKYPPW